MFKFDVFHMDMAGACYYSVAVSPDKAPTRESMARLIGPGHDVLTIARHRSKRAFNYPPFLCSVFRVNRASNGTFSTSQTAFAVAGATGCPVFSMPATVDTFSEALSASARALSPCFVRHIFSASTSGTITKSLH